MTGDRKAIVNDAKRGVTRLLGEHWEFVTAVTHLIRE
jgi:hypothetical protein